MARAEESHEGLIEPASKPYTVAANKNVTFIPIWIFMNFEFDSIILCFCCFLCGGAQGKVFLALSNIIAVSFLIK